MSGMKSWGSTLMFLGVGSFVLNWMGYEFVFLSWIDTWGVATGNALRVAVAVVGAVLYVVGMKSEAKAAASQARSDESAAN